MYSFLHHEIAEEKKQKGKKFRSSFFLVASNVLGRYLKSHHVPPSATSTQARKSLFQAATTKCLFDGVLRPSLRWTKFTLDDVSRRQSAFQSSIFFFFLSCLLFSEIYVEPTLPSTESHSTEHVKQVKHVLLVAAENHCGWKKEKCLSEGERVCQNAVVKKKSNRNLFCKYFFVECVSARVSFLFSPFVTFFFLLFIQSLLEKHFCVIFSSKGCSIM